MEASLRKALLEISTLAAMQAEDSYGYKLIRDLQPVLEITESTLYPILKRLEAGGCVTVYSVEHNNRLRRYYRITETGRKRIADFLAEWEELRRVYEFIEGGRTHDQTGIS